MARCRVGGRQREPWEMVLKVVVLWAGVQAGRDFFSILRVAREVLDWQSLKRDFPDGSGQNSPMWGGMGRLWHDLRRPSHCAVPRDRGLVAQEAVPAVRVSAGFADV